MTKKAKTITYAAGIFTAFWLIIAFLITSVEAVAYWTPGYYEKDQVPGFKRSSGNDNG